MSAICRHRRSRSSPVVSTAVTRYVCRPICTEAFGCERRLSHQAGCLALPPLGYVCAEFRPGCLFLSSFHTFPGEHTVIKTQSLIEKK